MLYASCRSGPKSSSIGGLTIPDVLHYPSRFLYILQGVFSYFSTTAEVSCVLLQASPHVLIHWRPDAGTYKAFLTRSAPAGDKVDRTAAIEMPVLPSTKDMGDSVTPFTVWHTTTEDDSELMNFICVPVVGSGLGSLGVGVTQPEA
jgi:hypothetical protein